MILAYIPSLLLCFARSCQYQPTSSLDSHFSAHPLTTEESYVYMSKAYISEIPPANRNRLGRNFTQRAQLVWHAPEQTFGVLHQTGANGGEKTHFANVLSPKQRIVSPTSRLPISVKLEYKK